MCTSIETSSRFSHFRTIILNLFAMPHCPATKHIMYTELCGSTKGGLISESFSFWLKSPKKVPNLHPEHLLFRWIELKIVFWHIFWEIGANVIIFLRLSHLYVRRDSVTTSFFLLLFLPIFSQITFISDLVFVPKSQQRIISNTVTLFRSLI